MSPALLGRLVDLIEGLALADSAYHDPAVRARCARGGWVLVASRRGGTQAPDDGTAGRQVFHALRTQAVASWKRQFNHRFALSGHLPTRGLLATQRFVLGAVVVSQLTVRDRFLAGRPLRAGLQAALHAALHAA